MAEHDPAHTSQAPNVGPQTNATYWAFTVSQPFRFSPVIDSSGEVYAVSGHRVYAINANGSVKWYASVFDPVASPALGPDGTLYVPSRKFISAFTPEGFLKWNLSTPDFNEGADLTVAPSGQIYSVNNGILYSISPSGQVSWTLSTGCVTSAVAIGQAGTLYCGGRRSTNGGVLNAIDPHGAIVWSYPIGNDNPVDLTPTVGTNGTIYATAADGTFLALSPVGVPQWEVVNMTTMNAPAAVGPDGTIYIGGPVLYALSPDGFLEWSLSCYYGLGSVCEPFGTVNGLTVDSNGTLYVTATLGQASRLLVFDSFGDFLWSFAAPPGQTFPDGGAIGQNGLMYLGSYCNSCQAGMGSGRLFALGEQGPNGTLNFQSNLPTGQLWGVLLDGQKYVTTNQSMTIATADGVHAWSTNATISVISGIRYTLLGNASGSVALNGNATVKLDFAEQDLVRFTATPAAGGSISQSLAWLATLSKVNVTATPASGYRFDRWISNTTQLALANSTLPTTSLLVNGTGGVTAVFAVSPTSLEANLTISSGEGGSVSYRYAQIQGTVPPGGSSTIVVPVGAGVLVEANPSTGYVLSAWNSVPPTSSYGNLSSVVFRVLESSRLGASFALQSSTTFTTVTTTTSSSRVTTTFSTTQTATKITATTTSGVQTGRGILGTHITVADAGLILVGAGVIILLLLVIVRLRPRSRPAQQ